MYRKFYGLAEAPFSLTPDPRFLFLSQRHREALGVLLYGVEEHKGFIVLTGAIGAGKSTVCRALINELNPSTTHVALILNSFLNEMELLKAINDELGLPSHFDTRKGLIDELNRFLLQERAEGHTVVLILDEAQNLSREVLEQLRMLSNLETETEKLIQIILIGQPELDAILRRADLEQLNQRVQVRYHITPLTLDETKQYIRHRLFVARTRIEIDFTPEALKVIHDYSGGVPRLINLACDRALLAGYVDAVYEIDERIARDAVAEVAGAGGAAGAQRGRRSPPGRRSALARIQWKKVFSPLNLALALFGAIAIGGAAIAGLALSGAYGPLSRLRATAPSAAGAASASATVTTPGAQVEFAALPAVPPPDAGPPAPDAGAPTTATATAAETTTPTREPPRRIQTLTSRAWVYLEQDASPGPPIKFMQVTDERHALAGALVTALAAWNVILDDLKPLRNGDEATAEAVIARLGLTDRRLRMVTLTGKTLTEAIDADAPLLLKVQCDPADPDFPYLAPHLALMRVQGEALTVANPFRGIQTFRRAQLEPRVTDIRAIYLDTQNWSALTKGDESAPVETLRASLAEGGFLKGRPGNRYDSALEAAIMAFQRFHHLTPSGQLDELTLLMLSARADPARPRLFQASGD